MTLSIYEDEITIPRLKSRRPFLARVKSIKNHRYLQPDAWNEERKSDIPATGFLVDNVHNKPSESDLPRRLLTKLNRMYVSARVGVTIYRINGESKQTLSVIVVQTKKS